MADEASVHIAGVRDDAATLGLKAVEAALFPDSATSRGIEEGEGAVPSRQSVPTWLTAPRQVAKDPVEKRSLILRVFLPFVFGYYIAYLFRTINAVMAAPLATELGLGADDLGLLTSVYFLTFAAAQIPIGILLDRHGPRRVQSALLVIAAIGSALFAVSGHFWMLLVGRALIGLGVASAMTAGLKALVLWFPGDRVPLLNGLMVMLGALGAVTATLPADLLLDWIGWRELFGLFAGLTAASAVLIYLIVPEATPVPSGAVSAGLRKVYADPRFWRVAPLSASCIGTAWALQGLWAAQWLKDVEGLDRAGVVFHLFAMAVALSLGAMLLGVAADRLRGRGVGPEVLLGLVAALFIVTQFALILRLPLPSYLQWAVVAAVGAATVLSFAILAEYFPKELAGQRGAEFVPHRRSVRCAIRDRRRASALDASSWTLSRNRLSDGPCAQSRASGRGMDLVHVPASQNLFATKAHARAVVGVAAIPLIRSQRRCTQQTGAHGTPIKCRYICRARITNCPLMEGEAVHGQATRSVSAHDHLFASVRLMMNAIVLSSRSGSDWRSKWPRKQRRGKPPARNIRHLISNY
jgi:MFS family permease